MKIKICGVTHPEDAFQAGRLGAHYIGIVFAKHSKRRLDGLAGRRIADAAKEAGAIPVAVFADETLEEIDFLCKQAGVSAIQLHGDGSRQCLSRLEGRYAPLIYAVSAPALTLGLPPSVHPLFDSKEAGSGKPFDWNTFSPPKGKEWFLAGGLNPGNVAEAIRLFHPYGIDVSSGVAFPEGVRKDPLLMEAFIHHATKEKR